MFCTVNSYFWLLFCFCMHVFLLFFFLCVCHRCDWLPATTTTTTTTTTTNITAQILLLPSRCHWSSSSFVRRNVQWWPRSMLQSSTSGKWRRTSGRRVSSLKWGGNSRGGSCPELLPAHTRRSVLTHGTSPCSSATSSEITDTQTQVRFGSSIVYWGEMRGS